MNEPRLQQLFAEVLDLPPHDRAVFIERRCSGDEGLAADLRGLLDAHEAASTRPGFLSHLDTEIASRLVWDAAQFSWADPLREGDEIGPYRIQGKLGEGGMGVVYLAHDPRLDRRVALKLLPAHLQADRAARRRLSDEARAASALDHPNIATIYDIAEPDDGPSFIAMAYCEGVTLKERLAEGPLPEAEAIAIARQVAAGLGAAHERGIIHRDVKPANVVVAPDGRARIVDFGIARLAGTGEAREGATPGTIAYMSPEQTRGEAIDHRSDLWSLGVMLHEMVTGGRPFEAEDDAGTIAAIRHDPAPAHALPPVRRALEKEADRRFATADEFVAELAAMTSEAPGRSRHPVAWIGGAAVLAAASLFAILGPLRPPVDPVTATADPAAGTALGTVERLAVMPLRHEGSDSTRAYVAEGLSDDLAASLAGLSGVRVIGRRSVRAFADRQLPARQIGDSLGVDVLLAGDLRWEGDRGRLDLRLVDAASGSDRWSERYDVTAEASFALEERIGRDVVAALSLRPTAAEVARLADRGTRDPEAFRAYHRGRYYWNRRDREGLLRAQSEYERAIDLDPAYADAWAGLADVYLLQAGRGIIPPTEAYPLARQSAEQAIALEPDHAGALMVLGSVQLEWYYDWRAAEESALAALASDPEYATAHYWYSELLSFMGRTDEAVEHAQVAQELEPLMLLAHADEARALYIDGRFEAAIEAWEAVLERGWDFVSYLYVPLAHSQLGQHEEAVRTMERFVEAAPTAYERHLAGYVYARAGRTTEADSVLAEARTQYEQGRVPAVVVATIHVGRDEWDAAIRWFERSLENREWQMIFLPHEPMFDPLRDDARFQDLITRVGP